MKDSNYWSSVLGRRHNRRHVIAGGLALGAGGAVTAISCGGKNNGSQAGQTQGQTKTPEDTTKQAVRGGTFKNLANSDVPTWDPNLRQSASTGIPTDAYLSLTNYKPGLLKPPPDGEMEPVIAESWEVLDGGTRYVMKLRSNARFDPRAPTNGRAVDADDVLYSWNYFAAVSRNRARLSNAANKSAPLQSIRAVDSHTIELNLAFPSVEFLDVLLFLPIMPREADGKFDSRAEMRGTGPYMVTDYKPSIGATFTQVPDHFLKDRFFPQTLEYPIVPEYAAELAQFRAGNVYSFPVNQEDVVQTKADVPALDLYQEKRVSTLNGHMPLGWLEGSPFRDVRVRQAAKMAIDEDAFLDAMFNVSAFRSKGLPVDVFTNSPFLTAANTGLWLDPKSSDFGPNAKFMKFNPDEAKKLLAAAGYPNGLDVPTYYFTSAEYTLAFPKEIDAVLGMFRDVGIRPSAQVLNYQSEWIPKIFNGRGKFVGMSFTLQASSQASILSLQFMRDGARFYGFDVNGRDPEGGDPTLEDMIKKQLVEFDAKKRAAQVGDIQRYLAEKQYYPSFIPAYATSFKLAWPTVRNFMAWQRVTAPATEPLDFMWLDPTKAPNKAS